MDKRKLKDLKLTSSYLREDSDIEALAKSIEAVGLIHPLTINEDNELLAGSRRYQALKHLGVEEVNVIVSEKSRLEQELISIDENLVRKPLNKIEFEKCLNRGREIYEELNPSAKKIEIEKEAQTKEEKCLEKEQEEQDETSFAAVTAQKLGVSKAVIKKAIRRDAKSSDDVKKARSEGEISASQVNEIIKLSDEEQNIVLPYVKDKTVKEVRSLVDDIRAHGLDGAINKSLKEKKLPKEVIQLESQIKKCIKMISKVMIEDFDTSHPGFKKVLAQVSDLQSLAASFQTKYESDITSNSLENNWQ